MVLRSIVDHYNRVARDTMKRVVGVLRGSSVKGTIDVTNSYAVPFEEDDKNPSIWFLDHVYHESMFPMLAGDGTTTSVVLAQGLIAEGVKVVAAGANPVLITRGIEKTTKALVAELKAISKDVEDSELADVAAVSAGNNYEVGNMIAEALSKVGRKSVVNLEEGRSAENSLYVVEGMQFDRGYSSPYFVTDSEKMTVEYENWKLLLVDKKITNTRDLIGVLEDAIRGSYPVLIIAEDIEQEVLGTLVVNKLKGALKVSALKAPGFRERKSQYLDDIAILTGGTVIREEVGLTLDKADKSVLGHVAKVMLIKDSTIIVGDGSSQDAVSKRDAQVKNLIETADQDYEKEKLNERIAKLSGGVAVIQVGAQTETELKGKKLPLNHEILYHLQDVFNLLPNLNVTELDKSFLIPVEDVLTIQGRGTVAIGQTVSYAHLVS
ncbi:hypothetical protein ACS0TY_004095 [Phlomoides rotata]